MGFIILLLKVIAGVNIAKAVHALFLKVILKILHLLKVYKLYKQWHLNSSTLFIKVLKKV